MTTYAKLIDDAIIILERVPRVINSTKQQWTAYAAAGGYKALRCTERPGQYYTAGYKESAKLITETWTPWELPAAKADALQRVQDQLDARLSARATVPCVGIPTDIIYDPAALTNALGLEPGDVFIDAADNLHTLTEELILNIRSALKNYRMGLYAAATDFRRRIAVAENVDAVEEVVSSLF